MYIYYFYQFYLSKTLIVIYLFKLLRLLHDRIDPTVELLKKNPQTLKRKEADNTSTSSVPPTGAPSWCLNHEALKQFNRSSDNVPVFDYDTDEDEDNIDNYNIDDDDDEAPNPDRRKKRKKKSKKKRNSKKHK